MGRRPRDDKEPGFHHIWGRGNNRQLIFVEDGDQRRYLRLLAETVVEYEWRCLAYCLMGNHVHLLIETTVPNLADGMCWLHGEYARRYNRLHGRVNHLFGGRYGSARQASDGQLKHTARYIAMNPVEAGLCQFPENWAWSSHRAVVEDAGPPWLDRARLLEFFGGDPRRYAEFVALPDSQALRPAA